MEQFVYHNLFETKGIEYLITIVFFALLVPFWLTLNKKSITKEQAEKASGTITADILRVPQGLFYCPNHMWLYLEKSGLAKTGIDDFLQHAVGEFRVTHLADKNSRIKKGEPLFEIWQDGKSMTLTAPVTGTITGINTGPDKNRQQLNSDPYETGWIYEIKPENWKAETASCYLAEEALNWMQTEVTGLENFINDSASKHMQGTDKSVYMDNAGVIDNVLSGMTFKVWNDFEKEFLNFT